MPILGLTKANLISRGVARYSDLLYLALQDRKLFKRSVAHTRLAGIDASQVAAAMDLPWQAVGMCVVKKPSERLIVISGDGAVFTYVGGNEGTEQIAGPRDLRACATIEGYAYACGMGRQVYCREREGMWPAMHAPAGTGDDVLGFEAIAGFSRRDLYAVGWQGEVWHFDGKKWSDSSSPVNVVLTGVSCADNGEVYACGQAGTLLRGRNGQWELIETDGLTDDFWDVRWFAGRLYVASMTALYELQGDELVVVDFGADAPDSCYKLTDAEGVLWSIGQENIFSFDGSAWQRWE